MLYLKLIVLFHIFIATLLANVSFLSDEENNYLKHKKVLKIQNMDAFPPFNFYENNTAKGYSVDYLTHMAKILNVKLEFIHGKTWSEYMKMLKTGELDIIPHLAHTKEREKYYLFTSFNHIEYVTGIATNKDISINSLKDLNGLVLAVSKNSFIHKFFMKNYPNQKLYLTSHTKGSIEALVENKADVVIGSYPVLDYYKNKNWLSGIKITKLNDSKIATTTQMPMGVPKDNKLLKSILDKVHNQIPLSDDLKMKQKWMEFSKSISTRIDLNQNEIIYLKNKKIIKMCIDPDWMPFEKNDDGQHIGMTADYFKHFGDILNLPIKMVPTKTWLESLEYGKMRKCDIFSLMMPTPEREKYLIFTQPYLSVPLVIATKMQHPFINNIPSIVNQPIGIVKGYAYGELLKLKYPKMNLVEVENINEGLEAVNKEKLFGFIGTLSTVGFNIQKEYVSELKIAGKFDDTWSLGIGVRDDEPILKDIFNKVIGSVSAEKNQEILNKWIAVKYQKVIDYTYLFELSVIFILILLIILYKNRTMNKLNQKILFAHREIQEQQKMVNKYVRILTTDLDGKITYVNEAYLNAIGYTSSELIGQYHTLLRHPDMEHNVFKQMWTQIQKDQSWQGEVKNIKKDGSEIVFNMYIEPIYKDGNKIGYRSISEDITDKKRIELLSITDKLTGLYNRVKLDETISFKFEEFKRYKIDFSIILLDIDDFKHVNDDYGHDVGDYVLQEIANILKENIRVTDIVGRWGGEEFVIVCDNTNVDNSFILAENIRKLVEKHSFETIGKSTISLGVAQLNQNDTISTLFKRTDEALYKAKNSGKNKTCKENL